MKNIFLLVFLFAVSNLSAQVNLTLKNNLKLKVTQVKQGETLSLSGQIYNDGNRYSKSTELLFLIGKGRIPSRNDEIVEEAYTVTAIKNRRYQNFQFDVPIPSALKTGNYNLFVIINPLSNKETSYRDNWKALSFEVGNKVVKITTPKKSKEQPRPPRKKGKKKPRDRAYDLSPTVKRHEVNVKPGDQIRLNMRVINSGGKSSPSNKLNVYVGKEVKRSSRDQKLKTLFSGIVKPFSSSYPKTLVQLPTGLSPGRYYLHIEIENKQGDDYDPKNNVYTKEIKILEGGKEPSNLIFNDVDVNNARAGAQTRVYVRLSNIGKGKSSVGEIHFFLSRRNGGKDQFLQKIPLDSIRPGSKWWERIYLTIPKNTRRGSYYITAQIVVPEHNEIDVRNNIGSERFSIR